MWVFTSSLFWHSPVKIPNVSMWPWHLFLDCCNNSYLFSPLSVLDNLCYFQHDTLTDLFKMWIKSYDSSTWDPHTWSKIQVLPYAPAIPFLDVYPKELKSGCGRLCAFCNHCSIIHSSKDVRWHNMSLSKRTDKSYVVLTYGVYYSLLKACSVWQYRWNLRALYLVERANHRKMKVV